MTITINDYQRLMGLVEFASLKTKVPRGASQLIENLQTARLLSQSEIRDNIVTMNSRVKLKNQDSGIEIEVTIAYPEDAEPRERRVSVVSEIGLALLGRRENDEVSWRVPGGVGRFEIQKIMYQPEAAGDYHL
jgi:regulator of nucleoside diphosphate kinase